MSEEKREQQGFKVSDRRQRFDREPAPAGGEAAPSPPAEQAAGSPAGAPADSPAGAPPPGGGQAPGAEERMPPDFAHLVTRLAQEALFFMGEIPDPATGQAERNLAAASYTIDTLDMLRAKTKGNLADGESRMIEAYLAELRVRFLRASGFLQEGR